MTKIETSIGWRQDHLINNVADKFIKKTYVEMGPNMTKIKRDLDHNIENLIAMMPDQEPGIKKLYGELWKFVESKFV